jgi:hypothetical protein
VAEVEDQPSTGPVPAADATTPLSLFMARALSHWPRRADGDDPADVDVTVIIETGKFLNAAGIPLPSDECLRELIGMQDGSPSDGYLKRGVAGDGYRSAYSKNPRCAD